MDTDNSTNPENESPAEEPSVSEQAPQEIVAAPAPEKAPEVTSSSADALSLTPEEIAEQKAEQVASGGVSAQPDQPAVKKVPFIKQIFRKVNVYFLLFVLLVVIAGIIAAVNYLNSQKAPTEPNIQSQTLSEDALKQLANTDATVGNSSQTLTIQGNAVINGQTLTRGNLNIAGNLQTGGSIQGPTLTISGTTNLGDTQINSLQIATNLAVQGSTTLRDLNVAGSSSFSGAMTASQITVSRLILSGNATLEIPNHISFTGASPSRIANGGVLGNGGTSSINGSDTAGTVNIGSGNNPTPGCLVRVNFQQAFTKTPHVIISPVGSGAGSLQFYTDRNASGFSICSNNAAPANQTFSFDYFVSY